MPERLHRWPWPLHTRGKGCAADAAAAVAMSVQAKEGRVPHRPRQSAPLPRREGSGAAAVG